MLSTRRLGLALSALLAGCLVAISAAAMPVQASGLQPQNSAALLLPHVPPTTIGTIADLGAEVQNNRLLQPVGVNSSQEVAFYGGAVWKNGTIIYVQAPSSDPTATFTATAINDAGVVVGYATSGGSSYKPAYWNTSASTSFTEVSVSALMVAGQPATGGNFEAIDAAGDAVGSVWNSSGNLDGGEGSSGYSNNSGLSMSGSSGVPSGSPTVLATIGGQAVYSLDGVSAGYEEANRSEVRPELLIARSTQTVTTTDISAGEATPVEMASNGTITGFVNGPGSATLTIRLASGSESQLVWPSGYSGPAVSVNSSNTAVGWVYPISGPSSGAMPAIWSSGSPGQLLLPQVNGGSAWSNTSPTAINDQGYIVGYGTYSGTQSAFLISTKIKVPPVVNSTADAPAADPSSGSCDTGNTVANAQGSLVPQCTLRAAIQTVNALNNQTAVTFDIPSSTTPAITPASGLPTVTAAGTVIDGTSQTGGQVTVDGGSAGKGVDCLNLAASGVTVKGVDLINCPAGVELQAPGNDKLQSDLIGLKTDGKTAASGGIGVQIDPGSSGNLIGGPQAALGDVISAQGMAIDIAGSGNTIQGDLLGTTSSGSDFVPDQLGVVISPGATGNTIGGSTGSAGKAPGNVIVAGSSKSTVSYAVLLLSASNTLAGNAIGTSAAGDTVYAPKAGMPASEILVADAAQNNVIGGPSGSGNVIAGAAKSQVLLDGAGARKDRVVGNRIGAGNNGKVLETKDSVGVMIAGADDDLIGSTGEDNTITGQKYGVDIDKESQEIDYTVAETVDGQTTYETYAIAGTDTPAKQTGATVKDNVIGPLPGGRLVPDTPQQVGILDDGGDQDLIGPRNQIAWNVTGIKLKETKTVQIDGNLIGTDASGLDALPNLTGVQIDRSKETALGLAGEPDTISGNRLGVSVDGAKNIIRAELIGPNANGNAALKAHAGKLPVALTRDDLSPGGIDIGTGAGVTIIGWGDKGDGVTVAGVDGDGLLATGKVFLIDDRFGIGTNGHSVVPNKGSAIDSRNADALLILHTKLDHSDRYGLREQDGGRAAEVVDSQIYDNAKGGIDATGVKTPQPAKLMSAINGGSQTDVKLDIHIPAGDTAQVTLYASPSCEAHGAGRTVVDENGHLKAGSHYGIERALDHTEPVGTAITALVTEGSGGKLADALDDDTHLDDGTTSEFSACTTVKASK
jgi:CSLREA domain-containing protein